MEEDDEFGDLYTDVLTPFMNSSSLPIQNTVSIHSDRQESVVEPPNLDDSDSHRGLSQIKLDEPKWSARVLEGDSKVNLPDSQKRGFEDPNLVDESQINVIVEEGLDGDNQTFDIEGVDTEIGDSVIPGLSIPGVSGSAINGKDVDFGEGDDWDSDSDDDLQIVLNDNSHGPMSMGGMVGLNDDDADEDGDPLVIVADSDANHQHIEEQDWGEDAVAAQGGDVESKDLGDGSVKANAVVPPPKTGYGYHHQYHLQFKYVRPGAPPIPGAGPLPPGAPLGQIRPHLGVGPITGRGRGDWRPAGMQNAPSIQKGFHAGYGTAVWANNTPGHGFGRGLDFTLPSHKTIFEVDIDSFEEKPWRLPGIDISDYFNFGLNEDSWKDYCKQLEQLRLEATMQSKIRVYESGRTEQDYDPDMPPELAAAAGVRDIPSDNVNLGTEIGQSDIATASMHSRPILPTGRPIQVEAGYGERLPSIDTRPPRMRDADAIIEIVLQDSADDDSVDGNDIAELPEDTSKEGLRGGHAIEEDDAQEDTEVLDGAPQAYSDQKRELARRKSPLNKPAHGRKIAGDGNSPNMLDAPVQNPSISREQTPVFPGLQRDERRRKGRVHERSPSKTRSGSTHDKRRRDFNRDETADSNGKGSPHVSSRHTGGIIEDQYFEERDTVHDDEQDVRMGKPEIDQNEIPTQSIKKQKLGSQVEQPSLEEVDDEEEFKAARSSENSKAISGSSRDYRSLQDGAEDEVVQHGRSARMGMKRKYNEVDYRPRSRGREERHDIDRHHMVIKGREDSYHRKNWDSNMTHHLHLKPEVVDRRKESDIDGGWQRRDEESHGKRTRPEDTRKRDRGDEMEPRHRTMVRDVERNDIDQYQHRKQLDNGNWRSHHDKDMGSRHRDRDNNLKARVDNLDDLNSKQRKEVVYLKREHGEKEDLLHAHRENTSRRKRERDDILEHKKRDELARIRNDDQQSVRHKEDMWFQRDRLDRQRERDDWQRLKHSHEEILPKREREDIRGVKTGRTSEEKSWASHSRAKDELKGSEKEYHLKDPGRHSEQVKRRDRLENESLSRQRGSEDVYSRAGQPNNDERRSRHERASGRYDRAINASDHHKVPEKKHKDYPRKSKEPEGDHNSAVISRRNQEDHDNQISDRVRLRGIIERGSGDQAIPVTRQSSKRRKEDASSDDEQHDSKRGRSKLERWTSHKERDFNAGRSSSSLNVKEVSDQKKVVTLSTDAFPDESSKAEETGQKPNLLTNEIDTADQMNKYVEVKPKEDKHLDTVEKLKKRSERFKLPMPSEKEPVTVKKVENEQLPPVQSESCTNLDIKQERPARKRRWTGN